MGTLNSYQGRDTGPWVGSSSSVPAVCRAAFRVRAGWLGPFYTPSIIYDSSIEQSPGPQGLLPGVVPMMGIPPWLLMNAPRGFSGYTLGR